MAVNLKSFTLCPRRFTFDQGCLICVWIPTGSIILRQDVDFMAKELSMTLWALSQSEMMRDVSSLFNHAEQMGI